MRASLGRRTAPSRGASRYSSPLSCRMWAGTVCESGARKRPINGGRDVAMSLRTKHATTNTGLESRDRASFVLCDSDPA